MALKMSVSLKGKITKSYRDFKGKIAEEYREFPQITKTRPHKAFKSWVKPTFFVLAFGYFVVITIIATATAGYQFVPIVTTAWIDPNSFWFNKLIPNSYRPKTRICGGHTFRIGDSYLP
jgi:hypothetical protein